MTRQQIPLTFGPGLDRATGILGVPPRAGRDLRNVYLYRDKAQTRAGYTITATFTDETNNPISHIVLVHPMRSESIGIVVGYQQTSRTVIVYLVDGNGTNPIRIGTWFTLASGAHEPPRILAAESYRKVFLAHDEPIFAARAPTIYYNPYGPTELTTLTADLDRNGTAETIRFRGVQEYLNYLVGWGYGTGSDEDRPEIIRVSLPGNPTSWEPEHYFLAGIGSDPVIRCLPTTDRLIVFKESQQYEIVGYDRRTFGIKPSDPLYGLASSRLATTVNGIIYFWSQEGPRATTGGASQDLSWPLDLKAPSPTDLVTEGATNDGFATYLPERRIVQFIFGRRCYNLSLWDETPKWSYGELAIPAASGGLIYGDNTSSQAPTAAPSNISGTSTNPNRLRIQWTNNNLTGGEIIEIWLKPSGGTWSRHTALPAGGTSQQTEIDNLQPGRNHNIATRYRRGTRYSPDSSSNNPDDWPASQKGTASTTLNSPTITNTSWTRTSATSEHISITIRPAHAEADIILRRGGTTIATITSSQHGGNPYTYNDTGCTPEADNSYDAIHQRDVSSPPSNTATQWAGPAAPTDPTAETVDACNYYVAWNLGQPGVATEIWDDWPNQPDRTLVYTTTTNATTAGISHGGQSTCGGTMIGVTIQIRHRLTQFGVTDYSRFTPEPPASISLCDTCS